MIHGSLSLGRLSLIVFDEPTETVAIQLYNQIMNNFYYNSTTSDQLPSIWAFLPLDAIAGKPHFLKVLHNFCNLFHAHVFSPTTLDALHASLLHHCVPRPTPRYPLAHALPLRQVEEVIARLQKVKKAQIRHHPEIEAKKRVRGELWVKTQRAKAGLLDAKKIIDEFISSSNKSIEEINKSLNQHLKLMKRVEFETCSFHSQKVQYFVSKIKEVSCLAPFIDGTHFEELKASTLSFKKKSDAENYTLLELLRTLY